MRKLNLFFKQNEKMSNKNILKLLLKNLFVTMNLDIYKQVSYSQEGEDLILKRFFDGKQDGFYVDVGAHHPFRFSNTHAFYKEGWSGINIDPMPGSMRTFSRIRKRDINLEVGISDCKGEQTYFLFDEPALNGFDEKLSHFRDINTQYKLMGKQQVKTYPLAFILEKYLPEGKSIDFLSIDVEGLEEEVLDSNDWECFRPHVILVEIREKTLESLEKDPIFRKLKSLRYCLYAKTVNTFFFVSQ